MLISSSLFLLFDCENITLHDLRPSESPSNPSLVYLKEAHVSVFLFLPFPFFPSFYFHQNYTLYQRSPNRGIQHHQTFFQNCCWLKYGIRLICLHVSTGCYNVIIFLLLLGDISGTFGLAGTQSVRVEDDQRTPVTAHVIMHIWGFC